MIKVTNLTKTFQSGRGRVTAIRDLSLTVPGGCVAALMGKSGSGKSTLLNCMGGLDKPDQGAIVCFGTKIHRLSAGKLCRFQRRHLGFVFQRGNLLSYLTVAENIGLPLTLNGVGGAERRQRVEDLLEAIDLRAAAKALPHELSGGETQRVSVARAIAHRPALLLADEPTANLDTVTGQRVVQLMLALGAQTGCTILMATHDRELSAIAGMVIHLKDGSIIRENV
jgi:ABC-type lipoprotein export system ATPase subunit